MAKFLSYDTFVGNAIISNAIELPSGSMYITFDNISRYEEIVMKRFEKDGYYCRFVSSSIDSFANEYPSFSRQTKQFSGAWFISSEDFLLMPRYFRDGISDEVRTLFEEFDNKRLPLKVPNIQGTTVELHA